MSPKIVEILGIVAQHDRRASKSMDARRNTGMYIEAPMVTNSFFSISQPYPEPARNLRVIDRKLGRNIGMRLDRVQKVDM